MTRSLLLLLVTHAALATEFDSTRGAAIFATQGCLMCHAANRVVHSESPTALATTIWNHAPTMWKAIQDMGSTPPPLDEQASGDLFAYFYSVRAFELPADAGRGKRVFTEKGCAGCHGLSAPGPGGASSVANWKSLGQPVALAEAMWNHSPYMRQEMGRHGKKWPHLTAQDLTDLEVYVRNSPAGRGKLSSFRISDTREAGSSLFRSKGCEECHATSIPLDNRIKGLTLTGIAAEMWNHAPLMSAAPPRFEGDEMRQLLSYLWARQFFSASGNAERGRRLFVGKRCSTCHDNASNGAPHLPSAAGTFNAIDMVSALWRHGSKMLGRMQENNVPWPRLETRDMSDIVTYLNAGKRK
jgi:cytochrome c551/c552